MTTYSKLFSIILLAALGCVGPVWADQGTACKPGEPSCPAEGAPENAGESGTPAKGDSLIPEPAWAPSWFPKLLEVQSNIVLQRMPTFPSPYEGTNSLSFQHDRGRDTTNTSGIYVGSQLAATLQAYIDLELFKGNGISNGIGLGGYVNADVIRAGSSDLPKEPYVARLYVRYYHPLSSETEQLERAMDQLAGDQPIARWEVKAGKLAPSDDFDQNRYANNGRTQFMNYDFLINPSWDEASDTRGYSYGFVAAMVQPLWRLAFGMYKEPNTPNGANFNFDMNKVGYNLELDVKPNSTGTVVRLLSYINQAPMGNYDAALVEGQETGTTPSLLAVENPRNTKYGFGLNFEQPLADGGDTGIFGRLGWNDGHNETYAYTEVDRNVSLGVQVSGVRWGRKEDCVGLAYGVNGISSQHEAYLAAGGLGILLGDGALNYGLEQTLETYYRIQLLRHIQLSPDFQFIQNPAYNRDRGPVEVYGVRLRLDF